MAPYQCFSSVVLYYGDIFVGRDGRVKLETIYDTNRARLAVKPYWSGSYEARTMTEDETYVYTNPNNSKEVFEVVIESIFYTDTRKIVKLHVCSGEKPTPTPEASRITIASNPTGAQIFMGGLPTGQNTPYTFDLSPGTYSVMCRKAGYVDKTETVSVLFGGQSFTHTITLSPEPTHGSIRATSDPSGATIHIDQIYRGLTPITVSDIPIGMHEISASLFAHEFQKRGVEVIGNQVTDTHFVMEPTVTPQTATIKVSTYPDDAGIWKDGVYVGRAPQTITGLSTGSYNIKAAKSGYEPKTERVTITAGDTKEIYISLKPIVTPEPTPLPTQGSIRVTTTPSEATVNIDGIYRGLSPITVPNMPTGMHEVSVQKFGYKSATKGANVVAGVTTDVNFELEAALVHTGVINVSTTPEECIIFLDGDVQGRSPISLEGLAAGTYEVKAGWPGYNPSSKIVSISTGQVKSIHITLYPVPQEPTPVPTPTPTPVPGTATIKVSAVPIDAVIFLDGDYVGRAPISLVDLAAGTYEVKGGYPGHYPTTKMVTVSTGQTVSVFLRLEPEVTPVTPETSDITIKSNPTGANIVVSGIDSGKLTPSTLKLEPGTYIITCRKSGYYDRSQTVTILLPGTSAEYSFVLSELPAANLGHITVTSTPSNATVLMDKIYRGLTPITIRDIPIGMHEFTVDTLGYQLETRGVEIKPGITVTAHFDLEPSLTPETATLIVETFPSNASVWLDDVYKGLSPQTITGLAPGTYVVKASKPDYQVVTEEVWLARGDTQTVTLALPPVVTPIPPSTPPEENTFRVTVSDIPAEGIEIIAMDQETVLGVPVCAFGYCVRDKIIAKQRISPPVPATTTIWFNQGLGFEIGKKYVFYPLVSTADILNTPYFKEEEFIEFKPGVNAVQLKGYPELYSWQKSLCDMFGVEERNCLQDLYGLGRDFIYSKDAWSKVWHGKDAEGAPSTPTGWDYFFVGLDLLPFAGMVGSVGGKSVGMAGTKLLEVADKIGQATLFNWIEQVTRGKLIRAISGSDADGLDNLMRYLSDKDFTHATAWVENYAAMPMVDDLSALTGISHVIDLILDVSGSAPVKAADDIMDAMDLHKVRVDTILELGKKHTNSVDDLAEFVRKGLVGDPIDLYNSVRKNSDLWYTPIEGTEKLVVGGIRPIDIYVFDVIKDPAKVARLTEHPVSYNLFIDDLMKAAGERPKTVSKVINEVSDTEFENIVKFFEDAGDPTYARRMRLLRTKADDMDDGLAKAQDKLSTIKEIPTEEGRLLAAEAAEETVINGAKNATPQQLSKYEQFVEVLKGPLYSKLLGRITGAASTERIQQGQGVTSFWDLPLWAKAAAIAIVFSGINALIGIPGKILQTIQEFCFPLFIAEEALQASQFAGFPLSTRMYQWPNMSPAERQNLLEDYRAYVREREEFHAYVDENKGIFEAFCLLFDKFYHLYWQADQLQIDTINKMLDSLESGNPLCDGFVTLECTADKDNTVIYVNLPQSYVAQIVHSANSKVYLNEVCIPAGMTEIAVHAAKEGYETQTKFVAVNPGLAGTTIDVSKFVMVPRQADEYGNLTTPLVDMPPNLDLGNIYCSTIDPEGRSISGAKIIIDGKNTGYTTPELIRYQTPGSHVVKFEMLNYVTTQVTVTVTAAQTIDATGTLNKAVGEGSINVFCKGNYCERGVKIYLDGKDTGQKCTSEPFSREIPASPGAHTVKLSLESNLMTAEGPVTVDATSLKGEFTGTLFGTLQESVTTTITEIIDGDSIRTAYTDTLPEMSNGAPREIRMIGYDAFESGTPRGQAGTEKLKEIIDVGDTVELLIWNVVPLDMTELFRVLAGVFKNGEDITVDMLSSGLVNKITGTTLRAKFPWVDWAYYDSVWVDPNSVGELTVVTKDDTTGDLMKDVTVFVDGVDRGYAPQTTTKLTPGSHHIRLIRDGYTSVKHCTYLGTGSCTPGPAGPLEFDVNITAGDVTVLECSMVPTPKPDEGSLTFMTWDEVIGTELKSVTVYIDGVDKGYAPVTVSKLSEGSHLIKLVKTGYNSLQYCTHAAGAPCVLGARLPLEFYVMVTKDTVTVLECVLSEQAPPVVTTYPIDFQPTPSNAIVTVVPKGVSELSGRLSRITFTQTEPSTGTNIIQDILNKKG